MLFNSRNVGLLFTSEQGLNQKAVSVRAPVEDGTRVALKSGGEAYFDIARISDSDSFLIPLTVTLREAISTSATIDSDYISAIDSFDPENVYYDTISFAENETSLNQGYWLATVENLELNVNNTAADLDDSIVMTDSRFVENLVVNTGAGDDQVDVRTEGLSESLIVDTAEGNDQITINAVLGTGTVDIKAGQDADIINFNHLGATGKVTLAGEGSSDRYHLNLADEARGDITISDTASANTMRVNTGDSNDTLLFRTDLLYRQGIDQRIDFTGLSDIQLNTHDGDDHIIFDDTSSKVDGECRFR